MSLNIVYDLNMVKELEKNGWYLHQCKYCSSPFMSKLRVDDCCDSHGCREKNGYPRLIPKPSSHDAISFKQLREGAFSWMRHSVKDCKSRRLSLETHEDATLDDMVITGATIFRSYFKDGITPKHNGYFVLSPFIRSRSEDAALVPGNSSASVCIGSEILNITGNQHDYVTFRWLDALEMYGLSLDELKVRFSNYRTDWGNGEFRLDITDFIIDGVEIGSSQYAKVLLGQKKTAFLSDCCFNLERLALVINGQDEYNRMMYPFHLTCRMNIEEFDDVRAAVMLLMCGAEPHQGPFGEELCRRISRLEKCISKHEFAHVLDFYRQQLEDAMGCLANGRIFKSIISMLDEERKLKLKNTLPGAGFRQL